MKLVIDLDDWLYEYIKQSVERGTTADAVDFAIVKGKPYEEHDKLERGSE